MTLFYRWRLAFLLLWIGLLAVSGYYLPKLEFDFSLHPLLKGENAEAEAVKEFYRTFPPAEGHAVVTLTWDNPVTIDRLRQAADWAKELEKLPEVRRVYSPALLLDMNFQGFTLDEWARLGGTGSEPLELGDSPGMNTIKGRFISHDLRSLALHVQKDRGRMSRFVVALEDATAGWEAPAVRILGTELVIESMGQLLKDNLFQLLGLQLVALLVILPFFFRSFRMAYLPLATAATGLLVYFTVMTLAGQAIGLIYLAGPLLLVVIGLSDSIHLQQQFDDARAEGRSIPDSLWIMIRSVGAACVLTSLTTAIGFFSLGFAGHPEVRNFGIWCGIGVGISFVVVMLFMPVALAFFPGAGKRPRLRSRFAPRKLRRLTGPAFALLIALAAGTVFVKVDSSLTQELPSDTPAVKDLDWFAANFQGTERIEVELNGPLDKPAIFAAVENLQARLKQEKEVVDANSYVDVIRFMLPSEVVDTSDGPYLGMRALGEMGDFPENLITRSGDRAAVAFYTTNNFGSHQFQAFEKRFDQVSRQLPPELEAHLTGYRTMAYRNIHLITDTLFRSFGFSLVAITIVLAIALRSPSLALLCLIPNALPMLVATGVAGWMDIPLRVGMVIVFSVGLGLAVDDTIHLIVRFRQVRRANPGATIQEHLDESLRTAGFAVILTSVVLLIAASTFLRSDFSTMKETGIVLIVITSAALLADLVVFPWIIERAAGLKALAVKTHIPSTPSASSTP